MNRNEPTEIRHFLAFDDDVMLQVTSCDDAKAAAVENGHTAGQEGVRWWIEVHHYENDEPIAGGEWPCDCPSDANNPTIKENSNV